MKKLALICLIYATACCPKTAVDKSPEKTHQWFTDNGYQAMVIYIPEDMAGCNALLKAVNKLYQPLNLQDAFRREALEVWVKYHKEKNQMSTCMMGEIVTIDDIQLRK
jgi:hypothetical protein